MKEGPTPAGPRTSLSRATESATRFSPSTPDPCTTIENSPTMPSDSRKPCDQVSEILHGASQPRSLRFALSACLETTLFTVSGKCWQGNVELLICIHHGLQTRSSDSTSASTLAQKHLPTVSSALLIVLEIGKLSYDGVLAWSHRERLAPSRVAAISCVTFMRLDC